MTLKILSSIVFLIALNTTAHAVSKKEAGDIGAICGRYQYVSDQQSCLKKFSDKRVSKASLKVCVKYQYLNDQAACASSLANLRISEEAGSLCEKYQYVSDQVTCLKDLGNLKIEKSAMDVCKKYQYLSDQQSCFKQLAQKTSSGRGKNSSLIDQLSLVRDAINNDDSERALDLLDEAIEDLKNN